jgi:hypothetical protein
MAELKGGAMAQHVHGIRAAGGKPIPEGTRASVRLADIPGHLDIDLQLPWQHASTRFARLPIVDGWVDLPLKLVFLCHAMEDRDAVIEIGNRLLQDGFLTWFDEKDLLPGDSWEREIEQAISKSDYVLTFLSQASLSKTGYVQRELRLALSERDRRPFGSRYIVPILVDECDVPHEFRAIQFLPLWNPDAYETLKMSLSQSR